MTRGGSGDKMRVCYASILPPAIIKNVFDAYNFSIILNIFDNNKPFDVSSHNRKCAHKKHHNYLAKHSKLGSKNLNKIWLKIKKKTTKIATRTCKFSNCFRGSMPLDPHRAFSVSQSSSNLFCRKKNVEITARLF